jgi:hypothetical protein
MDGGYQAPQQSIPKHLAERQPALMRPSILNFIVTLKYFGERLKDSRNFEVLSLAVFIIKIPQKFDLLLIKRFFI